MGRDQSQAVVRKTEAVIADAVLPRVVKVAVELAPEVLPVTQGMSAPEAKPGSARAHYASRHGATPRLADWGKVVLCLRSTLSTQARTGKGTTGECSTPTRP
jgi:hypothetical protein